MYYLIVGRKLLLGPKQKNTNVGSLAEKSQGHFKQIMQLQTYKIQTTFYRVIGQLQSYDESNGGINYDSLQNIFVIMSERKDKNKFNRFQPYSYNTIYQSRIVSSYPFCSLARSQINHMISPYKTKEQTQIALNKQLPIQRLQQSRKPSVDYKRPRSLDFQNNLFHKLANKLQKQREIQTKRNQKVLNEYYDNTVNKENCNELNHNGDHKQIRRKPSVLSQKSVKLGNSRYQNHQPFPQKQKIKFNKLKQKATKKKSQQQIDFVRTSDAQFKITKTSLDMKPVF